MTLTVEMTVERVDAVIRALDSYTPDRRQQVFALRFAIQWIELAAFPDKFADPRNPGACWADLRPDALSPFQENG